MKKFIMGLGLLVLILGGVFFWLLSASSNANMPSDVTVIDLPDTYEK